MAFGRKSQSSSSSTSEHKSRKIFMRPGVIDEEPDSIDSVISNNPSLLPLTIVPTLVRSSTCGSGFSRTGSCK